MVQDLPRQAGRTERADDTFVCAVLRSHRFIAEDDYVVVVCRGGVTTKTGKPYHNAYCYVIRLEGGKLRELTEYLDTALVEAALIDPAKARSREMP
jgi:ketosteroid isomerase-like protein